MNRLKTLREYVDKELNHLAEDKRTSATAHLYPAFYSYINYMNRRILRQLKRLTRLFDY